MGARGSLFGILLVVLGYSFLYAEERPTKPFFYRGVIVEPSKFTFEQLLEKARIGSITAHKPGDEVHVRAYATPPTLNGLFASSSGYGSFVVSETTNNDLRGASWRVKVYNNQPPGDSIRAFGSVRTAPILLECTILIPPTVKPGNYAVVRGRISVPGIGPMPASGKRFTNANIVETSKDFELVIGP